MIGRVVGNYKIVEQIGAGGMGAVYRGVDVMLDRQVAIKCLRPEVADNPQILQRFRNEASALAKLNHPGIATLYAFFRHQDDYYMAMEFVQGRPLDEILDPKTPMQVDRAVAIFGQVLDAIDHAHRAGILHRDIKPGNIIVSDTDVAKVTDFGIARILGEAGLTRAGSMIGTIEYMAPERIRGFQADARSDVYSLGMVLYEMLTGRGPFEARSEYHLMKAHLKKAPMPPREVVSSIPEPIEGLVTRALSKSADDRPQTAAIFREQLHAAFSDRSAAPVKPAAVSAAGGSSEIGETRYAGPGTAPWPVPEQASRHLPAGARRAHLAARPARRPGPLTPLPVVSRAPADAGEPDWQTYAAIAAGAFLFGVIALILFKALT